MEFVIQEIPARGAGLDAAGGGAGGAEAGGADSTAPEAPRRPRHEWLRVRIPSGERFAELKTLIDRHRLQTVCEEARCPKIGECCDHGTATIMILGDVCTKIGRAHL